MDGFIYQSLVKFIYVRDWELVEAFLLFLS